ncbi:MAG: hypothetical protein IPM57_03385 [Oligoflexia bacterium]|nr:hypothetical protein [Oligoflexia bacterium]
MKTFTSLFITLAFFSSFALAQSSFISETDKNLTIKNVGVLPCSDNVKGLYSRHIENKLGSLVTEGHRFNLNDIKDVDPRLTTDEYSENSSIVKSIGRKNNVDALLISKVLKNEKALIIKLDLYLTSDGLLYASEEVNAGANFELKDVESKLSELYVKVVNKIPYKGLVLSRQAQRLTIDLGSLDGMKENEILTVEQVLTLKRHPKFNFVLGQEKEIIGKIKIIKSEPKLSFAVIVHEKEKGVITKNAKVSGADFISYSNEEPDLEVPKDKVSFGKNPKEWAPDKMPTLGLVGLAIGIGSSRYAMSLATAGSFSGSVSIYPQLDAHAEIWITRNWYVGAMIQQGVYSMGNPLDGSVPNTVNATTGHYDLHVGYKFLLQDDFWGPQIVADLGFSRYTLFIDASSPLAFTSTSYSGLYLGLGGSVPVDSDKIWTVDAKLQKVLFPIMTETPASSGAASDNSITVLGIGGSYKLTNQFKIKGMFDFEFYSSTFSGTGTRLDAGQNASQTLITLRGGLDYYF